MSPAYLPPEPADSSRIELIEDHELRYWTSRFRCSSKHLLDAIESVGVEVADVDEYLAIRRSES